MKTNRRTFFGALLGLFTAGAASPALAKAREPVKIDMKWTSYHVGGNWDHYLIIDGMRYASLYVMKNMYPDKPFMVSVCPRSLILEADKFETLEEAMDYIELRFEFYFVKRYQIPAWNVEFTVDRSKAIAGVHDELETRKTLDSWIDPNKATWCEKKEGMSYEEYVGHLKRVTWLK